MTAVEDFEQRFYLEHFRGRSILLSAVETDADALRGVAGTLADAGARVGLVVGRQGSVGVSDVGIRRATDAWLHMRLANPSTIEVADRPHEAAVALAAHLRPFKLVLVDGREPGLEDPPASFVTLGPSAVTLGPSAPGREPPSRVADPPDLPSGPHAGLAARAISAGVGSVNVCRPGQLGQELLTYRGAGVLYTPRQYCTVGPLRLDDFVAAEGLVRWGVAEGFLKDRPPEQVGELLLHGYGARFGDDHLAGFAALLTEPYADAGMGEVSALTTISRFAGGGVGGMIVRRMLADARRRGLAGVFACTTAEAAASFFTGLGFRVASPTDVPAAKWAGYDPDRRGRLRVLVHDLAEPDAGGGGPA